MTKAQILLEMQKIFNEIQVIVDLYYQNALKNFGFALEETSIIRIALESILHYKYIEYENYKREYLS